MIAPLAALAILAGCNQPASAPQKAAAPACDFDCTLDKHIKAIQQHDYAAFEPTITKGDAIDLILPNGEITAGRAAYTELLKDFLDDDYQFNPRVVRKRVGADMGYALLDVTQLNAGVPEPSRYYLLLIFALEDGEWRLVHDRNTRQPRPTPTPAAGG